MLTHWGRVTNICVSKLTIIGSDNVLSPDWHQAIIWTNAGLLLIGPLRTNLILIKILTFSFKKVCLKVSPVKRQPFCLGFNVSIMVITHNGHPIIHWWTGYGVSHVNLILTYNIHALQQWVCKIFSYWTMCLGLIYISCVLYVNI